MSSSLKKSLLIFSFIHFLSSCSLYANRYVSYYYSSKEFNDVNSYINEISENKTLMFDLNKELGTDYDITYFASGLCECNYFGFRSHDYIPEYEKTGEINNIKCPHFIFHYGASTLSIDDNEISIEYSAFEKDTISSNVSIVTSNDDKALFRYVFFDNNPLVKIRFTKINDDVNNLVNLIKEYYINCYNN